MLQVQAESQHALLLKPNVVGVAIGYKESGGVITDEPAVVVLVEQKKPLAALSAEEQIPREINGVRTDVYEVGYLQAQQQQDPKGRFRPTIPGGVSIAHYKVTAGTLGAMVRDRTTGERFILSNNHVLANSNEALVGDPILQPGPIDGGQNPGDVVSRLERFIALNYLEGPVGSPTPTPDPGGGTGGTNSCDIVNSLVGLANLLARLTGSSQRVQASTVAAPTMTGAGATTQATDNIVDAALARPVDPTMFTDQIRNIGVVRQTKAPALGMRIRKSGRTTDLTESTITLLNATVNVNYSTSQGGRTARYAGQIICEAMSQGGDSGSLIVDANENAAVGLLFAGSPLATIFTPIDVVTNALNITFEA
jgi:hypothetical protein